MDIEIPKTDIQTIKFLIDNSRLIVYCGDHNCPAGGQNNNAKGGDHVRTTANGGADEPRWLRL